VTYQSGSISDTQKAALAARLTEIMIQMEGSADTFGGRSFAWVIYDEIKHGDWWAGGRTDAQYVAPPGKFLVDVRIPEGYMNAAYKDEVQMGVNSALMDVLGASGEARAGGSAQVVIQEITEDNWAAAGKTISLANMQVRLAFLRRRSALRGYARTSPPRRDSSALPDIPAIPAGCCRQMREPA